ncbi:MAG: hypothetical protein K0S28_1460 [Paucimonas sp.]|jgi:hypothetical protein|nr:hypothetical protein [Paucimonas sp.]
MLRLYGGIQRRYVDLENDAVDGAHALHDLRYHGAALDCNLRADCATWFAWGTLSAFCLTVAVSSSIEEAVSSSAPA